VKSGAGPSSVGMGMTTAMSEMTADATDDRRRTGPRRGRRLLRRGPALFAVVSALALLAAACGDDDDSTSAAGGSEAGGGSGGGEMSIEFSSPEDGAEVGAPFDVEVDPSVDIGEPDTGLHHVHLYYDGNRSEDQSEYDILYEESFTVDRDLEPGEHTLEAVIANADHSLTDTSTEITVTVGEGGGGSGGGGGSDDTEPGGGYDY
jgi:hypothetical protein